MGWFRKRETEDKEGKVWQTYENDKDGSHIIVHGDRETVDNVDIFDDESKVNPKGKK